MVGLASLDPPYIYIYNGKPIGPARGCPIFAGFTRMIDTVPVTDRVDGFSTAKEYCANIQPLRLFQRRARRPEKA